MFFFIPYISTNNTYLLSLQNGVIRSNCIDCLDRINDYQQIIGTAVVIIQLDFSELIQKSQKMKMKKYMVY